MTTSSWTVVGMTCGHCASAVRAELGALDGVRDVRVAVDTGAVEVVSDVPLSRDVVAAAIDEAGYTLT